MLVRSGCINLTDIQRRKIKGIARLNDFTCMKLFDNSNNKKGIGIRWTIIDFSQCPPDHI